jgi:hypothetical protein
MFCAFAIAAALAFGIFCPALAKKVKSAFSKESAVAKTAATSAVSSAVSAEVKKL